MESAYLQILYSLICSLPENLTALLFKEPFQTLPPFFPPYITSLQDRCMRKFPRTLRTRLKELVQKKYSLCDSLLFDVEKVPSCFMSSSYHFLRGSSHSRIGKVVWLNKPFPQSYENPTFLTGDLRCTNTNSIRQQVPAYPSQICCNFEVI